MVRKKHAATWWLKLNVKHWFVLPPGDCCYNFSGSSIYLYMPQQFGDECRDRTLFFALGLYLGWEYNFYVETHQRLSGQTATATFYHGLPNDCKSEFLKHVLWMMSVEWSLSFTMIVNLISYCKHLQSYDTCKPLGVKNEKLTKQLLEYCIILFIKTPNDVTF